MEKPELFECGPVAGDIEIVRSYIPLPGFGVLPVNAFVIRGQQPVLVDTGLPALQDGFIEALGSSMDLADLQWVVVTHADPDHVGALDRVLQAAPKARVVTNFLGMGKLMMYGRIPPERFYLVNPGQSLDVGDRQLSFLRPPTYDAPETMAVYDPKNGALFSSDCFGALLEEPVLDASEVAPDRLRDGMVTWATVDAPWLAGTEAASLAVSVNEVASLSPEVILGAHLPVARGLTATLCGHLDGARSASPFVGPDQAALANAAE